MKNPRTMAGVLFVWPVPQSIIGSSASSDFFASP